MSMRKKRVHDLCSEALARVDEAIRCHHQGEPADLSIPLLQSVRRELQKMQQVLDPAVFSPSYGRFILDWPDEHGLVSFLLEVDYQYGRIKR